jgi:hypothetical protein
MATDPVKIVLLEHILTLWEVKNALHVKLASMRNQLVCLNVRVHVLPVNLLMVVPELIVPSSVFHAKQVNTPLGLETQYVVIAKLVLTAIALV